MLCLNLLAATLVIPYVICNVGAAPLRVSSISSRSRVVEARQQPSNTCTMTTAMMSYNLAGAMVTMTSVQADVNDTMVQAVQEGIMGAMMSLTMLNGAMSSGASVPSYLSSAMVGNITMSLNYIDTITGVPTVATAANLDEARQQLQNADQFAMMVSASCGAESTSAAPSANSARPSATPSTTASA